MKNKRNILWFCIIFFSLKLCLLSRSLVLYLNFAKKQIWRQHIFHWIFINNSSTALFYKLNRWIFWKYWIECFTLIIKINRLIFNEKIYLKAYVEGLNYYQFVFFVTRSTTVNDTVKRNSLCFSQKGIQLIYLFMSMKERIRSFVRYLLQHEKYY